MSVILYHNPKCSKSRAVLALIREKGIEPKIVEYLHQPLSENAIRDLLAKSGLSAAQAMRDDAAVYDEQIKGKNLTEAELIALMARYPALLNRPFVVSEKGAALCRPPEKVQTLL